MVRWVSGCNKDGAEGVRAAWGAYRRLKHGAAKGGAHQLVTVQ